MAESNSHSKSLPQRFSYAWEPLKSSFSVHIFGVVTIFEIIGLTFDWAEKLEKMNMWPSWAPTANICIYSVLAFMFGRAIFLLAEELGKTQENLNNANKSIKAHIGISESFHDIIHLTRDKLLADSRFRKYPLTTSKE